MKGFRYISGVTTLALDGEACTGCGACTEVCPHGLLRVEDRRARIADADECMECGACANNCPVGAITLTPGVGCAAYVLSSWVRGRDKASCGPGCC